MIRPRYVSKVQQEELVVPNKNFEELPLSTTAIEPELIKLNASEDVTVFIIVGGANPNLEDCCNAIAQQSVKTKVEIIQDVYPMSKAFNQMIDRCLTKYFIQVDQDMILYRDAVKILLDTIRERKSPIVAFQLKDVHLNKALFGVKIYDYDIIKNYRYNEKAVSCEVEQMERLKNDGYNVLADGLSYDVLGLHAPKWTNEGIFERYFNLMEKFKLYHYIWMKFLPRDLWIKFSENPTELNLFALLGAFSSISKKECIQVGEKDFRTARRKDCALAYSYFKEPKWASIYLTNKCNFACSYCTGKESRVSTPDLDVPICKELLAKFPTLSHVCIAGIGEPFLSPNLLSVVQFFNSKRIYTGIVTNGSLLTKHGDLIKACSPGHISVSLNAINEKDHYELNGTHSFNRVLDGIKLLVDLNINTYCSFICTKQNLSKIPFFIDLCNNLKVSKIHLTNLLPYVGGVKDRDFLNSVLTENEDEKINKIKQSYNNGTVLSWPVTLKKSGPRASCQFPWETISVDGAGYVSVCPCIFPPNKENGSIFDYVIWNNNYAINFRDSLLSSPRSECKVCFRNQ